MELPLVASVETALHVDGVTRHAEAEDPEHHGCEDVASGGCVRRLPFDGGVVLGLYGFEQVAHADDINKGRVLKERDEVVHDPRDHMLECLWKNDEPHPPPVSQPQSRCRLILPARDSL